MMNQTIKMLIFTLKKNSDLTEEVAILKDLLAQEKYFTILLN
jgi:hypothetical protein